MNSSKGKASDSPVSGLSAMLTPTQVNRFAQKALVELRLGQASLVLSLESGQIADAANQAHKLKSTISLFSAESLVNSLDLIEAGDSDIYLQEFRKALSTQCEELVKALEIYLAN